MKTYSRKRKTVEETAHIVVQDANFDEKRIKLEPGEEDPLQISSQPMLEFNNIKSETHVNSLIKDEITFSCSQNNSLAENISSASLEGQFNPIRLSPCLSIPSAHGTNMMNSRGNPSK